MEQGLHWQPQPEGGWSLHLAHLLPPRPQGEAASPESSEQRLLCALVTNTVPFLTFCALPPSPTFLLSKQLWERRAAPRRPTKLQGGQTQGFLWIDSHWSHPCPQSPACNPGTSPVGKTAAEPLRVAVQSYCTCRRNAQPVSRRLGTLGHRHWAMRWKARTSWLGQIRACHSEV